MSWSYEKVYLEQTRGEAGVRLESGELQAGRNEAGRLEVLIHKNTGKRKQRPDFNRRITTRKC